MTFAMFVLIKIQHNVRNKSVQQMENRNKQNQILVTLFLLYKGMRRLTNLVKIKGQ